MDVILKTLGLSNCIRDAVPKIMGREGRGFNESIEGGSIKVSFVVL